MESKLSKSQKGQGLIEYVLILILFAVIVVAVTLGVWVLIVKVIIANWPAIVAWGSNLVAGIQRGDPTSIFIAAVVVIAILWIVFRPRRR